MSQINKNMKNMMRRRDPPWGTNPHPRDSMDKLDTNRAEATALYNGIIDSQLLNSTGNLTNEIAQT